MIYRLPALDEAVDQGGIIDDCPLIAVASLGPVGNDDVHVEQWIARVVTLTQTCDLVQGRVSQVVVARVIPAEELVSQGRLKASDIRGPLRAGRVFGWYFLPQSRELGLPEMIVDLRQLHTIPLAVLLELCRRAQRRARVQPLYREHLAKHFADSYSRIGLPAPYETL
jgi:hypothetical protein